jgi:hypothetical protein
LPLLKEKPMSFHRLSAVVLMLALASALTVMAAPPSRWDTSKVVTEATGGQFKATAGKYFDKECNAYLDYTTEVVDLNDDGQPEVFTSVQGTCLGGMTGVSMNLYIKNTLGQWKPQFGFPGVYTVLKTKHKGYPDIEVGGPGTCFPVWRWNGQAYAIHKRCR